MSEVEDKLRAVWARYATQRQAEADLVRTHQEAAMELADLNAKRAKLGLPVVLEHSPNSGLVPNPGFTAVTWPLPRSWHDELDSELLSAVRSWLNGDGGSP